VSAADAEVRKTDISQYKTDISQFKTDISQYSSPRSPLLPTHVLLPECTRAKSRGNTGLRLRGDRQHLDGHPVHDALALPEQRRSGGGV
jgi:hypothetical protein